MSNGKAMTGITMFCGARAWEGSAVRSTAKEQRRATTDSYGSAGTAGSGVAMEEQSEALPRLGKAQTRNGVAEKRVEKKRVEKNRVAMAGHGTEAICVGNESMSPELSC